MSETPGASRFPGDLWLPLAGLVAGILLGPAVLGQLAPSTYRAWFVGAAEERARLEAWRERRASALEGLDGKRMDRANLEAWKQTLSKRGETLRADARRAIRESRRGRLGRLRAILLAALAFVVFEAITPAGPRRRRLAAARTALLSIWLALVVARPADLAAVPWAFFAGLVAIALVAALVPLRRAA